MRKINAEIALLWISYTVIAFSIAATIPSFFIWLGLPPEGDAVDYRLPLVKWVATHRTWPSWPWTMVDDYPPLGELLITGLYILHRNLMRLVPVLAYVGVGYVSGKILVEWITPPAWLSKKTLSAIAFAWILGLRPMALQSNLLMVDNLSTFFLLAALLFILKEKILWAGVFTGLALLTRYSAWPAAPALALAALLMGQTLKKRINNVLLLTAVSTVLVSPLLWRNWVLNHNPFFPIFNEYINGTVVDASYFLYGRGRDLLSLLMLPYDILYTNTYVQGFFDYTVGKLFYIQLAAFLFFCFWPRFRIQLPSTKKSQAIFAYGMIHTLTWFAGSQQMRFWVPVLVLLNLGMLALLLKRSNFKIIAPLIALTMFSIMSIQKDSVLIALGKKESIFSVAANKAVSCLSQIPLEEKVGYLWRDGTLGFVDHDFIFYLPHPYATNRSSPNYAEVNYLYTLEPKAGFAPWPEEKPCLLKRL